MSSRYLTQADHERVLEQLRRDAFALVRERMVEAAVAANARGASQAELEQALQSAIDEALEEAKQTAEAHLDAVAEDIP